MLAGFLSLGLGIIGIVLPLIPTTPLFLLAAFCFVKGSKKFDRWFKGTDMYKKYLEDFVRDKSMTRKQKWSISLFADVMIAIAFFLTDKIFVRIILLLVVAYKYYYFIYKIKTVN
ncbi:YbaN family protein [Niallia endozanthoxylica]|uniref:YbaN family protein n=1 Tax=Niallia endozanthoxylica TaxID=2036016 RepID=UPI001CC69C7C|nr:YbaN family protein [Niallia endozanthoxylica]